MKNAVVTGGGSGIGRAVAHRLRADGMHVATIDVKPSDAEFAYTADVTDRAQVDAHSMPSARNSARLRCSSTPLAWRASSGFPTSPSMRGST